MPEDNETSPADPNSNEPLEETTNPTSLASQRSRRSFLLGTSAGIAAGSAIGWTAYQLYSTRSVSVPVEDPQSPIDAGWRMEGAPGRFPGQVVEVQGISLDFKNAKGYVPRDPRRIQAMIAKGMQSLGGGDDDVQAWRYLFSPGDRVGIKVVSVGRPNSISSFEAVAEIIARLQDAGVKKKDVVVFDRFKDEFIKAGFPNHLPEGVAWACAAASREGDGLDLDGQGGKNVAGYDRDVFRELSYCLPGHDPSDDRGFRSHLMSIVSQRVDKFISLPVLQDHRAAGVGLSLKNLSQGLVNNTARAAVRFSDREPSAIGGSLNQTGEFIPAVATLPPIRRKAVLQILDGSAGIWEGGSDDGSGTVHAWNQGGLFLATDPAALDHVGWRILDEKRVREGWPKIAAMGLAGQPGKSGAPPTEHYHHRQPQHVPLASVAGLGVFDWPRVNHRQLSVE